jgi:hypothetical protein
MGRHKGDRNRWSVNLWATPEERAAIEALADRQDEPVAALLLRLALEAVLRAK